MITVRATCIPEKVDDMRDWQSFIPEMVFVGERVFEVEILGGVTFFKHMVRLYHYTWINIANPLWGTLVRPHLNAENETKSMVGKRYIFLKRPGFTSPNYMNVGDQTYYWQEDAIKFDTRITIDIGGEELVII